MPIKIVEHEKMVPKTFERAQTIAKSLKKALDEHQAVDNAGDVPLHLCQKAIAAGCKAADWSSLRINLQAGLRVGPWDVLAAAGVIADALGNAAEHWALHFDALEFRMQPVPPIVEPADGYSHHRLVMPIGVPNPNALFLVSLAEAMGDAWHSEQLNSTYLFKSRATWANLAIVGNTLDDKLQARRELLIAGCQWLCRRKAGLSQQLEGQGLALAVYKVRMPADLDATCIDSILALIEQFAIEIATWSGQKPELSVWARLFGPSDPGWMHPEVTIPALRDFNDEIQLLLDDHEQNFNPGVGLDIMRLKALQQALFWLALPASHKDQDESHFHRVINRNLGEIMNTSNTKAGASNTPTGLAAEASPNLGGLRLWSSKRTLNELYDAIHRAESADDRLRNMFGDIALRVAYDVRHAMCGNRLTKPSPGGALYGTEADVVNTIMASTILARAATDNVVSGRDAELLLAMHKAFSDALVVGWGADTAKIVLDAATEALCKPAKQVEDRMNFLASYLISLNKAGRQEKLANIFATICSKPELAEPIAAKDYRRNFDAVWTDPRF